MSEATVNGIQIYHELTGGGEPLALVHGSWADATNWELVLPGLAQGFRVLTYDRRGYSRSERPDTAWSIDDDGDDLAALLETLQLSPAHVATISYGGNIALRLAARRPQLFRTLSCHEPPLFDVLDDSESEQMLARSAPTLATVGDASPWATTRARRASSRRRSCSVQAPGSMHCRPRRRRTWWRTPLPSSCNSKTPTRAPSTATR